MEGKRKTSPAKVTCFEDLLMTAARNMTIRLQDFLINLS